ncbi:hypothetical protein MAPG_08482 [Magnaporthiopsis poae ATCC 64411]|uniref:Uncharacterized protein n=1 Tax=Magnaporthiopsis poae (strain ATCC 64411 / 73-15) TaxID=644358 RepID=A0A0C4E7G9_MAGP6|nr:hypothetical protein MAPG_08482 [Magnaporthiopsis poae ATCC 64411]
MCVCKASLGGMVTHHGCNTTHLSSRIYNTLVIHMNLFDQVNRFFSEDRMPIPGSGERRARDNVRPLVLEIQNGDLSIKLKYTPQYNPGLSDEAAASMNRFLNKTIAAFWNLIFGGLAAGRKWLESIGTGTGRKPAR